MAAADPQVRTHERNSFQPEQQFKTPGGREALAAFRVAQADLAKAPGNLLLLARCGDPEGKGPERLVVVKDADHWPEDRLVSYVVLLDGFRRIRLLQVVPNAESGDWYEQEDCLFRPDGSLQYWERYRGAFDPDEPAKTWIACAWSPEGAALDRASLQLDPDGKPWRGAAPRSVDPPPLRAKALIAQHRLAEALAAAKVDFR